MLVAAVNSTKVICVYARYSTPEQKQRSIDRQTERCVAVIGAHLGGAPYQLFADRGYSATLLKDRPDLMAMLELVKTGTVRCIVIEAMDRLSAANTPKAAAAAS